jgi:hypothetical protein
MCELRSVGLHVAVEWLALPPRIREAPASNLGPETGYPDSFFVIFLSPSRKMPR